MSVIVDLDTLVSANFVHTNVTYEHAETKTDPTIMSEAEFLRTSPDYNFNGKILFVKAVRGVSTEKGDTRELNWFIDGYIQYDNAVNFNDVVIHEIIDELESVLNLNNNSSSRNYGFYIDDYEYNEDIINAQIDFVIRAKKPDVDAIT